MATNLPSCFSIQFLEQLLKFLVNFTLLKYVKSQRSYGFLITKELIFGFQILDLKDHFSASLNLKLYTKLLTEKIRKLDVDASREEGKRFKSQIHLIIISSDCSGPFGSNITCVHLLPEQNLSSKIQAYNTKIA